MLDEEELRSYVGHDVVDQNGKSIGWVDTIFNDDETGEPEWIGVLMGVFRQRKHLVPAAMAEKGNGSLRLPLTKDSISRAPTYDKEDRKGLLGLGQYRLAISKEKEQEAYAYYERLGR